MGTSRRGFLRSALAAGALIAAGPMLARRLDVVHQPMMGRVDTFRVFKFDIDAIDRAQQISNTKVASQKLIDDWVEQFQVDLSAEYRKLSA